MTSLGVSQATLPGVRADNSLRAFLETQKVYACPKTLKRSLLVLVTILCLWGCQDNNKPQRVPGSTAPDFQHDSVAVAVELSSDKGISKLESVRQTTLPSYVTIPGCDRTGKNKLTCARAREAQLIRQYSRQLRREGESLHIRLKSGSEKILQDNRSENHKRVIYSLINLYPSIKHALIHEQYYECDSYTLLNLDNGQLQTSGYALVSPDNNWVLAFNEGDFLCGAGTLRVYKVLPTALVAVYNLKEDVMYGWTPVAAHWINSKTAKIEINLYPDNRPINESLASAVYLKLHNNGWKLQYRP